MQRDQALEERVKSLENEVKELTALVDSLKINKVAYSTNSQDASSAHNNNLKKNINNNNKKQNDKVQIGDYVKSINKSWFQGTGTRLGESGYWTFIKTEQGERRKTYHNIVKQHQGFQRGSPL